MQRKKEKKLGKRLRHNVRRLKIALRPLFLASGNTSPPSKSLSFAPVWHLRCFCDPFPPRRSKAKDKEQARAVEKHSMMQRSIRVRASAAEASTSTSASSPKPLRALRAIVVGGGPGGLSTAIALANARGPRPWKVEVFEKRPLHEVVDGSDERKT